MKVRLHNEWFRTVSLNNRKSCPCCKERLAEGESIWSWGEYVRAKWRTVKYFCKSCFEKEVVDPLMEHTHGCGCNIELRFQSPQPDWLKLPETCTTKD